MLHFLLQNQNDAECKHGQVVTMLTERRLSDLTHIVFWGDKEWMLY